MAHILAIDDDEIICDFVADVLEDAGHSVTIVMNGIDAIAKVELHRPDVVLLDYGLPGLSGIAILQQIQRDGLINSVPVVMMTTQRSGWSVKLAAGLGASGYLKKPFSSGDLLSAIRSHIWTRRRCADGGSILRAGQSFYMPDLSPILQRPAVVNSTDQ